MRDEFYYPSRDKVTHIHGMEWKPEGDVKAVLQMCHGMVEYIDRYDEFASYLAGQGYYVVGNDHLGHGKSVQSEAEYGFFHESKGNEYVIGDIHSLRERTREKYKEVPYFILGHSMGSFLLRQYIATYGDGLSGAIIMGTGYKGKCILTAGRGLCRIIALSKGWRYRSELVNKLGIGSYNKRFMPSKSKKDWVTSDTQIRDAYESDPLCSFTFTVNGYYHMFGGMKELTDKEKLEQIPKTLPILFVSGKEDPVGDFGKGVWRVYQQYKNLGIQDMNIKLYKDARHEILNEVERQQVYEDLHRWLEAKRKK